MDCVNLYDPYRLRTTKQQFVEVYADEVLRVSKKINADNMRGSLFSQPINQSVKNQLVSGLHQAASRHGNTTVSKVQ